jgi:hypothetical protein
MPDEPCEVLRHRHVFPSNAARRYRPSRRRPSLREELRSASATCDIAVPARRTVTMLFTPIPNAAGLTRQLAATVAVSTGFVAFYSLSGQHTTAATEVTRCFRSLLYHLVHPGHPVAFNSTVMQTFYSGPTQLAEPSSA